MPVNSGRTQSSIALASAILASIALNGSTSTGGEVGADEGGADGDAGGKSREGSKNASRSTPGRELDDEAAATGLATRCLATMFRHAGHVASSVGAMFESAAAESHSVRTKGNPLARAASRRSSARGAWVQFMGRAYHGEKGLANHLSIEDGRGHSVEILHGREKKNQVTDFFFAWRTHERTVRSGTPKDRATSLGVLSEALAILSSTFAFSSSV